MSTFLGGARYSAFDVSLVFYLSLCLCICLSLWLHICLSFCLHICLHLCLHLCLYLCQHIKYPCVSLSAYLSVSLFAYLSVSVVVICHSVYVMYVSVSIHTSTFMSLHGATCAGIAKLQQSRFWPFKQQFGG